MGCGEEGTGEEVAQGSAKDETHVIKTLLKMPLTINKRPALLCSLRGSGKAREYGRYQIQQRE